MEIILAAALLPAIILMVYVYKHDKIEKEPFVLLLTLFAFGALSCVPAGILGDLFYCLLKIVHPAAQSVRDDILFFFRKFFFLHQSVYI